MWLQILYLLKLVLVHRGNFEAILLPTTVVDQRLYHLKLIKGNGKQKQTVGCSYNIGNTIAPE